MLVGTLPPRRCMARSLLVRRFGGRHCSAAERRERRVVRLVGVRVPHPLERLLKRRAVGARDLEPDEDVRALRPGAAVVKERDVPARGDAVEEAPERPRPLGELHAEEHLVAHLRAPARKLAQELLCELVVAEVGGGEARLLHAPVERRELCLALVVRQAHGVQHVRRTRVVLAVLEFGDVEAPDAAAKVFEGAGAFRDGGDKNRLATEPNVGNLAHDTEPIEVHVCAGGDGDAARALDAVVLDVRFGARHRNRPRGLEDRARVEKDVFDRGADSGGVDEYDSVDEVAADAEALLPNHLDRHPVREPVHVGELHALAFAQALRHGV
mmetsp:Transcript_29052/g.94864  ORF Transcript_29052/g.94864 Transcript_29052/m.94864 type:complete len:326 (-) Transcript_29052:878-1855(-)